MKNRRTPEEMQKVYAQAKADIDKGMTRTEVARKHKINAGLMIKRLGIPNLKAKSKVTRKSPSPKKEVIRFEVPPASAERFAVAFVDFETLRRLIND